ncbi:unnamed protein product [Nesidiocoris tenuis]|uniref:Uncharacterized protein n=1 Tax=Nesidiocoris tenuis TaxID=355587 RepID=A0A6H5GWX3_9HEMI|nr:unnamed protein product [Nesidiocoris tenuis]
MLQGLKISAAQLGRFRDWLPVTLTNPKVTPKDDSNTSNTWTHRNTRALPRRQKKKTMYPVY